MYTDIISHKSLRSALLTGAALVIGTTGLGTTAFAQDSGQAARTEKITVTGTRIKQRDYSSISPLATVGSEELSLTGTVNTEQLINTLPQIIPSVTITSNNPSLNGFALADLRGLGAGRTLVLINGRRANPSSASGLVDLNTIPVNLIERVEIISGGASAVYGADAVAGAINFILKEDYEGITLGALYQQSEEGEAPQFVLDGLFGGTFDDNRGAMQASIQYYNRPPVDASQRFHSRYAAAVLTRAGRIFPSFSLSDFGIAGTGPFFPGGSATSPWGSIGGFSLANVTAISGLVLDNDCNPANGVQSTGGTIRFRTGGGIAPFQNCPHPNFTDGSVDADGDRYNFSPDNYLILGNERINASLFGKYEIVGDGILEMFADMMFTNSNSEQKLAATPATGLQVKYDLNPAVGTIAVNPYVAAQTQLHDLARLQFGCPGDPFSTCLDNRTFVLNIRTTQVGNRFGFIETNAFSTNHGFRGTIPSIDWDWEVYHGYARNVTTVKNDNNIGRTAFTQLLNACNTTSTAPQLAPIGALPNCPFPHNSAAGGAFIPTATTNNPLGVFALSPAMINFVRVNSTDTIVYERTIVSANATGDVIDLWGEGAIGMAIGAEYREEELDSRVDPFKASADIIGFNAQKSIKGAYDVYEIYGEVNIPLLSEEFLAHKLEVVGGYRKSDYSTGAGVTDTYKYGAEWAPVDWLTFRGIVNHAVRAPSAFELFRAGDQNFPAYADPCNSTTVAANPGFIPACTAWFASAGVVYDPLTFSQTNSQVQAFLFGNPNLQPEIGDTLTYGVVFQPDWWPIGSLNLAVDRYEIELDNRIAQLSIAQILAACIAGGGTNVVPECAKSPRDPLGIPPGNIASVDQSLGNIPGVTEFSGIDVNMRWSWDMEDDIGVPGTFAVQSFYTWADEAGTSEGLYVGSIGGVIPIHKAATTFTYGLEDWTFLLRWTYLDEVESRIFGGGTLTEFLPTYNLYDVSGRWQVSEDIAFSFGVDNIFDKQPPVWAGAVGAGQFNTDGSTYEQLGRQWWLGLRWTN